MASLRASVENVATTNKPTAMDHQFVDQLLANRDTLPLPQNLGSILNAVLKSSRLTPFETALMEARERIGAEITEQCKVWYLEVVGGVEGLLGVREECLRVKEQAEGISEALKGDLQKAHQSAMERHETQRALLESKRQLWQCQITVSVLEECQEVEILIKDRRFLEVIRRLQVIEEQVAMIDGKLVNPMREWLVQQRNVLKRASQAMLTDWLTRVRESAPELGKRAISQAQARIEQTGSVDPADLLDVIQVTDLLTARILSISVEGQGGSSSSFAQTLTENRALQLELVLDRLCRVEDTDTQVISDWLAGLLGHLLVDHRLAFLPQHVFGDWEGGWRSGASRINAIVTDSLHRCQVPASLVRIKWSLVFAAKALEVYGYDASLLADSLAALYYGHAELLRVEQSRRIRELVLTGQLSGLSSLCQDFEDQTSSFVRGAEDLLALCEDDRSIMAPLKEAIFAVIEMQVDLSRATRIQADLEAVEPGRVLRESELRTLKIQVRNELQARINTRIDSLTRQYSAASVNELQSLMKVIEPSFVDSSIRYMSSKLLEMFTALDIDDTLLAKLSTDIGRLSLALTDSYGPSHSLAPLTQMFDLALSANPHDILDPRVRANRYPMIDLSTLRVFLSRLRLGEEGKRQAVEDLLLLLRTHT